MLCPTIHLNGTSKGELFEQVSDAIAALRAAEVRLDNAAPNGRDYYPQSTEALYTAQAEHVARLVKISQVRQELEAIQAHIADAEGGRP
jgi:hypothetical protein